jgi:hypothetical protein
MIKNEQRMFTQTLSLIFLENKYDIKCEDPLLVTYVM